MHYGIVAKGPLGIVYEIGCAVVTCQLAPATERLIWALNFRVIFLFGLGMVYEIVSVTGFN